MFRRISKNSLRFGDLFLVQHFLFEEEEMSPENCIWYLFLEKGIKNELKCLVVAAPNFKRLGKNPNETWTHPGQVITAEFRSKKLIWQKKEKE